MEEIFDLKGLLALIPIFMLNGEGGMQPKSGSGYHDYGTGPIGPIGGLCLIMVGAIYLSIFAWWIGLIFAFLVIAGFVFAISRK